MILRFIFILLESGICFYLNDVWCTDVTVLKKTCSPHLETLFLNCKPFYSPRECSSFVMVGVYIPPSACVADALQQLADQITDAEKKHPDSLAIIVGDFNGAKLNPELPKYRQHIKIPTRDKATDLNELTDTVTSYISFCEDIRVQTKTFCTSQQQQTLVYS